MKPKRIIKRVLLHLLFWVSLFLAQVYYGQISFNDLKGTPMAYLTPLRATVCLMLTYYPLAYYILPRYFYKRKYFKAILLLLLLVAGYAALDAAWEMNMLNNCRQCMERLRENQPSYYQYLKRGVLNMFFSRFISLGSLYQLLILLALPVGLKMGLAYFRERITSLQLAKENAELELNFLKAQVNPHFLFNTLNNINGLILSGQKEQSAETVSRLAGFMRYSLYQDEKKNMVSNEITLLKNYIELEKIRLNNTVINFNFDIDDALLFFPPLLFMPVLENAFKFCIERQGEDSWISIQLNIKGGEIFFKISNTYETGTPVTRGGIGLQNIQKRLRHYYGDKYSFEVNREEQIFTVTIQAHQTAYD